MSAAEILGLVFGSSVVSSGLTAWATLRGKKDDILHLSEIEFRKALITRVKQLEDLAARDTQRIRELEDENRRLRAEVYKLRNSS
jgi:hypothetical protein